MFGYTILELFGFFGIAIVSSLGFAVGMMLYYPFFYTIGYTILRLRNTDWKVVHKKRNYLKVVPFIVKCLLNGFYEGLVAPATFIRTKHFTWKPFFNFERRIHSELIIKDAN